MSIPTCFYDDWSTEELRAEIDRQELIAYRVPNAPASMKREAKAMLKAMKAQLSQRGEGV